MYSDMSCERVCAKSGVVWPGGGGGGGGGGGEGGEGGGGERRGLGKRDRKGGCKATLNIVW